MKVEGALLIEDITQSGASAKALEDQGFDCACSFEGPHDPFFPMVLAARETERVELATSIAIAFARNPMICAQIANDLSLICGGRFILGLGSQIRPHIEKRFSQTWSKPAARMREFVLAIRAIWRSWAGNERLNFRGEFYTHTLMTPFFNPGPNPYGNPRIFLAGVGPKMVEVAGEVADGFFLHPLHSRDFALAATIPAVKRGLARAGRDRSSYEISCQIITMMGSNDEEIATARNKARGQISFYGSTPAYKGVLDHHGWEDLQPQLNRMSKEGKWLEMMGLITDEMLDIIGVSGTPSEVGVKLRERNDFADRIGVILYNETDPEAVVDVVRGIKQGGR
jgi:probable F420-dependent oxidoreductase